MAVAAKKIAQLKRQKPCKIATGSKIANQGNRIPKIKFEKNRERIIMIPLYCAFPFNIFDAEDDQFSEDNPMYINAAVETVIQVLEKQCQDDHAIFEMVQEYFDEDMGFYETNPEEVGMTWEKVRSFLIQHCKDNEVFEESYITLDDYIANGKTPESVWDEIKQKYHKFSNMDEWQIVDGEFKQNVWKKTGKRLCEFWKDYRRVNPIGDYVTNFYGKPFGEFGMKVRLNSKVTPDGIKFTGMAYNLLRLEQDIIQPELDEFRNKCKSGGEYASKDKKQRTDLKKAITNKAKVFGFSLYSISRVATFQAASENVIDQEDVNTYKDRSWKGLTNWMCVNKAKIEGWDKMKGTSHDVYPSFILFSVNTGDPEVPMKMYDDATKGQIYRPKLLDCLGSDWYENYIDYRDDEKAQSYEALEASADPLRKRPEDWLFESYQQGFEDYDIDDIPISIAGRQNNIDIIKRINPDYAESLLEAFKNAAGEAVEEGNEFKKLMEDQESEEFNVSGEVMISEDALSDEELMKAAQNAVKEQATDVIGEQIPVTPASQDLNLKIPEDKQDNASELQDSNTTSNSENIDMSGFDFTGVSLS